MKQFNYKIKREAGIHARVAVMLADECRKYKSNISIKKEDKIVSVCDLVEILGLNVRQNDIIEIQIDGEDEEKAQIELKKWLEEKVCI